MIFGVGHDTCIFSEVGFWSSPYVFSLGGRLLNPTKPLWAWIDTIIGHPHALPQTPQPKTNEIDQEPSQTNQNDNQWLRFLIMEAADKNIPLDLNVFTLKKAVDGMANGPPVKCKPTKSGSIFIEVVKKHQSKNLLRTTMLLGCIPVKVSPHRTLNSRKFVIKCQELDSMEEDDIKEELKHQGIIAVKRISVRYSLYVMTIKGQDIPEKSILDTWKKKQDLTFQTPKDASNAKNLDTPRIHAKERQFVLDVVRKGTM